MAAGSFPAVGHGSEPVEVLIAIVFIVEKHGSKTEVVGREASRNLPIFYDLRGIKRHRRHYSVWCDEGRPGDVVEDANGSYSFNVANAVIAQ